MEGGLAHACQKKVHEDLEKDYEIKGRPPLPPYLLPSMTKRT